MQEQYYKAMGVAQTAAALMPDTWKLKNVDIFPTFCYPVNFQVGGTA